MSISWLSGIISLIYRFLSRHTRVIALLFFAIIMLHIWRTLYIPSLDGPQHLYNANVIVQLLTGNDQFREFFRINPVIVGYWTGHFLLGFFKLIFPAWLTQKLFLMTYVLGMFFSFRYLVNSLSPGKVNLMIYLIFPFIFHFYLALGYYTFSMAVIFYFWAMGYWIRKGETMSWKEMISFSALAMGVFLSHGLVFLFFISSLFLYIVITRINIFLHRGKPCLKSIFRQLWKTTLSLIPSLVLWAIYIRSVMVINSTVTPAEYSFRNQVVMLIRIRQLVGFNHEVEAAPLKILFILLVILGITALILFIISHLPMNQGDRDIELDGKIYAWTAISLLFLVAYLFLPDRISAGSLTHRFGLFFFFSLITLLAFQPIPKFIQILTVLLLLGITWQARENQHHFMKALTSDIKDIRTMAPYMKDGSTIVSLNASNNWIHIHFPLYVAVDKPLVHLNNPQCAGQFPIIWNEERLPECLVGVDTYRPTDAPDVSGQGRSREQVDYITVFFQKSFWDNESNHYWHEILNNHYQLVMTTPRELGALYQRIDSTKYEKDPVGDHSGLQ